MVAVSWRLDEFKRSGYAHKAVLPPGSEGLAGALEVYDDHLGVADNCLRRLNRTSISAEDYISAVGRILALFEDFLASPQWQTMTRETVGYGGNSYSYCIGSIQSISRNSCVRHLITETFVDALMKGLEDLAKTSFKDIGYHSSYWFYESKFTLEALNRDMGFARRPEVVDGAS